MSASCRGFLSINLPICSLHVDRWKKVVPGYDRDVKGLEIHMCTPQLNSINS